MAGAAVAGAGLLLWANPGPRPELLVAPEARLIGVMTDKGRALDHETAQGFAAKTWLRRDGDMAEQALAADRGAFERGKGWLARDLSDGWRVVTIWGKRPDVQALRDACAPKTVLIARNGPDLEGPCRYFGKRALRRMGSLSITPTKHGLDVRPARAPDLKRLWTSD